MASTTAWREVRAQIINTPKREAAVQAQIAEVYAEMERYQHTLAQLRRAREKTQVAVATEMGVTQSEVSRLEKRTDTYLSTLENYVQALGGELRLLARFEGAEFELKLSDLAGDTAATPAEVVGTRHDLGSLPSGFTASDDAERKREKVRSALAKKKSIKTRQ